MKEDKSKEPVEHFDEETKDWLKEVLDKFELAGKNKKQLADTALAVVKAVKAFKADCKANKIQSPFKEKEKPAEDVE